jgi:ketosteroid isomerase-like protein
MSQHADTLQAMFEAFNRRDFEAAMQHLHPQVELRPALTELDVRDRYVGRGEFGQFLETITDAWETYVVEAEETIEGPEDRVLVAERWHARGRGGIEFDFELTDVYSFRDGLVARVDGFKDRAAALAALGSGVSAP